MASPKAVSERLNRAARGIMRSVSSFIASATELYSHAWVNEYPVITPESSRMEGEKGRGRRNLRLSRDSVVDNRPSLLRQRIRLHTSIDQICSLGSANQRPELLCVQQCLLDLLQRFVAVDGCFDSFAEGWSDALTVFR